MKFPCTRSVKHECEPQTNRIFWPKQPLPIQIKRFIHQHKRFIQTLTWKCFAIKLPFSDRLTQNQRKIERRTGSTGCVAGKTEINFHSGKHSWQQRKFALSRSHVKFKCNGFRLCRRCKHTFRHNFFTNRRW